MSLRFRTAVPAVLGLTLAFSLAVPDGPPGARALAGFTLRPILGAISGLRLLGQGSGGGGDAERWHAAYLEERARNVELRERLRSLPDLRGLSENPLAERSLAEGLPRIIAANVLGRDTTPLRDGILLDVGEEDGVRVGLPVTVGNVLVGIVVRVWSGRSCQVRLIDDPQFRMRAAVLVEGEAGEGEQALRPGNLEGLGDGRLAMRFVRGSGVVEGAPVVTTAEDWWMPSFLIAGTLSEVADSDHDGVPEVLVAPAVRLDVLTAVSVWRRPDPPPGPWRRDR